jgi:hypothetical protein
MTAPRLTGARYGFLAALESAYGTAFTLADATHGILVADEPDVNVEYADDGQRKFNAPATGAKWRNTTKSGRFAKFTALADLAGFGAAYSASNLPLADALIRASGFARTVVVTGGSESVTYTPSPLNALASVTARVYRRGLQYDLRGGLATFKVGGETGTIPRATFDLQGVMDALPTDLTLPAITYAGPNAAAIVPPKAEALTLTMGTNVPTRVREFEFTADRPIVARRLDNSTGGHGGFNSGAGRSFMLRAVVEAQALATTSPWHTSTTLNPFQLAETAGLISTLSLNVGATQYNRWRLSATNAQLQDFSEVEDGPTGLFELRWELKPSSFTADDEVSFIFN